MRASGWRNGAAGGAPGSPEHDARDWMRPERTPRCGAYVLARAGEVVGPIQTTRRPTTQSPHPCSEDRRATGPDSPQLPPARAEAHTPTPRKRASLLPAGPPDPADRAGCWPRISPARTPGGLPALSHTCNRDVDARSNRARRSPHDISGEPDPDARLDFAGAGESEIRADAIRCAQASRAWYPFPGSRPSFGIEFEHRQHQPSPDGIRSSSPKAKEARKT